MNKNKLFWWLLLFFVLTIPVNQELSTRILLILFFFSFFINTGYARLLYSSWDNWFFILVLILGITYSSDTNLGFSVLETNFSLFAIPFIFITIFPLDESKFQKILLSFLTGLLIACIVCFIHALISFLQTGSLSSFFFYQFTDILDFQPTYFAYYLCFGISAILYSIQHGKAKYSIKLGVGTILFFFIILMLTAGKTAYVSMLLVFSFFILKYLFTEGRNSTNVLTFGISIFLLISMLLLNYIEINTIFNHSAENSDYWERLDLWKSALNANTNWLLGVGTGDYKIVLNDYLRTHGFAHYADSNFNSHNQFIQTFLISGLLGVLSLLLLIARPLYLSVSHQNTLGIMTFFSFFVYGMTEVFLGRYQGVVFFSFLHQCFIFYYDSRSEQQVNQL